MRSSLGSGFNVPSPNTLEFLALPRPWPHPAPPVSRWRFARLAACNRPVFPQPQLLHLAAQSPLWRPAGFC